MLESPSGLQIANFRRAGSVSADTNARWWEKKDEGRAFPSRVSRSSSSFANVNGDGRLRAGGHAVPKKFDSSAIVIGISTLL